MAQRYRLWSNQQSSATSKPVSNRVGDVWCGVISMGNAFRLLKCLTAHYGRRCEPSSGPKRTILQAFAYTSNFFYGGNNPPTPAEASVVLGPRHQFPLGSPAFPLFLFYETTTAPVGVPSTPLSLAIPPW